MVMSAKYDKFLGDSNIWSGFPYSMGGRGEDVIMAAVPTLGSGNLRDVVQLPEGEDANEWLAVNVTDLFNQARMMYGMVAEFCTEEGCSQMTTGPHQTHHWTDANGKIIPCSASTYIDYSMSWVQDQVDDENIFPSQLDTLRELKATAHVNTSFKQLVLFSQQFRLVAESEMETLRSLVDKLVS